MTKRFKSALDLRSGDMIVDRDTYPYPVRNPVRRVTGTAPSFNVSTVAVAFDDGRQRDWPCDKQVELFCPDPLED